ncbi:13041_t:CDS:2, partial [Gigaspora margarita]
SEAFHEIDHRIEEIFSEINHRIGDETFLGENRSIGDDVSWTLKNGNKISKVLRQYCEKIPVKIQHAYFGVLDLLEEDVEVFSDCEWEEMVFDFKDNIKLENLQKNEQTSA